MNANYYTDPIYISYFIADNNLRNLALFSTDIGTMLGASDLYPANN